MNNLRLFGFIFLILQLDLQGQIVKVLYQSDPLEGVELIEKMSVNSVFTNDKGEADLGVFSGNSTILFFKTGFKTKYLSLEEITNAQFTIEMEVQSFNLDQITISGTKWYQPSDRSPAKIVKINRSDIQFLQPQTAADLLGISNKVFIQKSQQGGGSPMIRGFATNRLLYSVDGVRMNTAIFRGGNLHNVINLDPFAIESAEVLFGPGSVMYGSDAIGGVMAFQTLHPQLSKSDKTEVSGNISGRYSSANKEKTFHTDWMIGGKKWASVSSFSFWNYDHLRQGKYGPLDYVKKIYTVRQGDKDNIAIQRDSLLQIPSGYDQLNLMQKFRFQANKNLKFQFGFHYSATTDFGRYDRHLRFDGDLPRHAEWNYGPQRWMMNQLTMEYGHKKKLFDVFTIRLALQNFDESRIDRNFNKTNRNTQSERVMAYSANIDFSKGWKNSHHLFYGCEYVMNDVISKGYITNIVDNIRREGPSRYPTSVWYSAAIYINDEIKLGKSWTFQSGLRYNHFTLSSDFRSNLAYFPLPFSEAKINNGSLTGSIGAVIRPSDHFLIRLNLGTAFRSPNVDDIGKIFDSAVRFVTVPNDNLKAEYAYNSDLGFTYIFNDRLKMDVSAYYTYLRDALVRRNFQLSGKDSILFNGVNSKIQAIQNASFAKVYGVQAGIELKLMKNLLFLSDWNFQYGIEETEDKLLSPSRHVAPTFGSNRLRYQSGKLRLELNSIHQGTMRFEDLPLEERVKKEIYAKDPLGRCYAPGWYTINVKSAWQLNKNLQLTAGIENITDQRYRPYSSGISGPGINFIAGARWAYF